MKVFIIGTGLIGGSMALDIKSIYDDATIFGIDSNEKHLEEALNIGIIDQKATENELIIADLVIVAVPVDVALVILPEILNKIGEHTLVFDVGSTKNPICEAIENHQKGEILWLVIPLQEQNFLGQKQPLKVCLKAKQTSFVR
jgi:prephenate dehydrogenase